MNKVLIVIDMQNDFIDGALGTKEAMGILPDVIQKIKDFEGNIIYTRDTHKKDYLSTQEGKYLPVEHCIEGTYGWELQKDIKQLMEDTKSTVYNKNTFGSKELAQQLVKMNENKPVEEIELIGLCTDICVISNALTIKTFLPEVKISVDAKCCAGVTPESHQNALNAMKMCQIQIID
ncbi:cysteine hydrolase family protein [Sporanaerobacter sp. PP17-6a]|uniref:cysteine hydrolase family protein n=1 Tax=Sporanaerobacter sp. PP17-6a TaxID=1891289 RepID=UPI00089FB630|nr:isochorismatase family cysteine hydrolase [Sporanaerobacter sp. PP17-6a]SCL84320.1 nicotinamidase/pyrazinamidase [Sporanaerobacter sp. PP17-6a]